MRSSTSTAVGVTVALGALVAPFAHAEDVARKFRLSLAVGGAAMTEEVRSSSGNTLTVLDEAGNFVDRYNDPRNDAALTGALKARSDGVATLALQYAITPFVLIEARAGRRRETVGQIEVQEVLTFRRFVRLPAGEITRTPVQLNGLVRFRPHASFNPFVGAGVGYSANDFEASPELTQLATDLAAAEGRPTVLQSEDLFGRIDVTNEMARPVGPTTARVDDAFEWQIVGGAEWGFGARWAGFLDLGYAFSEARFDLRFDGAEDLGAGVPQATAVLGTPLADGPYGPFQTLEGGALDLTGDGVADPGYYFVEGGRFRLDGFTFQVGVRYTF